MHTKRDNYNLGCAGMAVATAPANSQFKTTNAFAYVVAGRALQKAATDNIAFVAAAGVVFANLAASKVAAFFFVIDNAGAIKIRQSDVKTHSTGAGYAPGAFEWPSEVAGETVIGAVKIATNGAGAFTPATTALNAANQTATYYDAAMDYGVPIPY